MNSFADAENLPDQFQRALSYWREIKGDGPIPYRHDFDPLDIPQLLPHVILTEVVRGKCEDRFEDFRFRLIGSYVDDRVKEKYAGRNLSTIDGKGPGSGIWEAYCEVEKEQTPTIKSFEYLGSAENLKKSWELYLPLSKSGERVDFIVVILLFE
jgi:hypothetical protein